MLRGIVDIGPVSKVLAEPVSRCRPLWPSPKNVRKHNLPLPASRCVLVVGGEQAGIPRGPRFCLRTSSLASLGFGDGPESGYAGTEPAQHMENLDVHEEPRQC